MKIKVLYKFCTDGDFSLRERDYFCCTGINVSVGEDEYYDYIGEKEFDYENVWECKMEAKHFLEDLLCDGIHISSSHYFLMEDFYHMIDSLIKFIDGNDSGSLVKELSGNQDGTEIGVCFV